MFDFNFSELILTKFIVLNKIFFAFFNENKAK